MYGLFYKVKEYFLAEQERWFLWLPVLFGCGIGIYFLLPSEPSLLVSAVMVESLVLLAYYWRFSYPKLLCLAAVAMMVAGFVNIQLKAYYLNSQGKLTEPIVDYLSGEIINIDHNYRGMERVVIKNPQNFEGKTYFGNYRISLRTKSSGLKVGDRAELVAKLMPLPAASMVGGYQFDRKFFFEELSGNGYAMASIGPIDCASPKVSVPSWKVKIEELRKHIVARINNILPADEAGITAAIIAGERGGIRREITENYRDSGLAHFLSISGLHMTMLAGLMFFLIRLIIALIPPLALRYDSKKISAVAAILLSFFYLLISGAEIPTQRAFIMTLIVLVGVLIGRKAISMKTIAWAALIVLIISPWALIGASFQMSFAAVVMLIAFYEKFAGPIQRFLNGGTNRSIGIINRTWRIVWAYFAGIVISDLVASLATLPFGIYHFNMISIYTSLGNFLAGPIIGLVIMPFVLINLMPDYKYQHSIYFQYNFGVTAIFFYLVVINLKRLKGRFKKFMALFIVAGTVAGFFCTSAGFASYFVKYFDNQETINTINMYLDDIPSDASVISDTMFVARLSQRDEIYERNYTDVTDVDYYIYDMRNASQRDKKQEEIEQLINEGYVKVVDEENIIVILSAK